MQTEVAEHRLRRQSGILPILRFHRRNLPARDMISLGGQLQVLQQVHLTAREVLIQETVIQHFTLYGKQRLTLFHIMPTAVAVPLQVRQSITT